MDCGLDAIANAVELSRTGYPAMETCVNTSYARTGVIRRIAADIAIQNAATRGLPRGSLTTMAQARETSYFPEITLLSASQICLSVNNIQHSHQRQFTLQKQTSLPSYTAMHNSPHPRPATWRIHRTQEST
jgi:hypothetical protein